MQCPADLHSILSKILRTGLLRIRAGCDSSDRIVAEADHLHNLPDLLDDYDPEKLLYYWQVERPQYIQTLTADERLAFEPMWSELERCVLSARELVVPAS